MERPRRRRWSVLLHVAPSLIVPLAIVGWAWFFGAGVEFENGWVVARLVGPPPCDRPFEDGCDQPLSISGERLADPADCSAERVDVCLLPLGSTDPRLLGRLKDRYELAYGVRVMVLPALAIPRESYAPERGQFSIDPLTYLIEDAYPHVATEPVLVLGVTAVDMYIPAIERWRFAFGGLRPNAGDGAIGVVSTYRMQAEEWAIWPGEVPLVFRYGYDAALVEERASRMVTKYVGLAHFGLPLRDDPASPMFNGILSVRDLDLMAGELGLEQAGQRDISGR